MIHAHSRLNLTEFIEYVNPVSGKLLRPRYPDLRYRVTGEAADDRFILATDARQWSHIGLQFLDDARNWWAVADLSDVVDPFEDLTSDKGLRVPSIPRFLFRIIAGEET